MGLRKILSIDGGGIRGIIPATLLLEIERLTGKPIYQLFDLIAGTSTGGIISLALNTPNENATNKYNAQDIIELYETYGQFIFQSSLLRRFSSLNYLFRTKYDPNTLEQVLDQYFGNTTLEQCLKPAIITSYDIERRIAYFFKSRHVHDGEPNTNFLLKDIARSTSAAPTFFQPSQIKSIDNKGDNYSAFIDGGVFANTPAMCAYVEAVKQFKGDDILLVSLGTGKLTKSYYYNNAKNWGLAKWALPILDILMDGSNETIDYQLDQLLPEVDNSQRYYRFQVRLSSDNTKFDDVSKLNVRMLKLYGEELIRENKKSIERLCKQLTEN